MDPSTRLLSMGAAGATSTGPGSYIEDVFNTWLYTGNASTQTITNGIDLSTNGGLVWIKRRDGVGQNQLFRQAEKRLASDDINAESTTTGAVTSFNTTGFSIGANYSTINGSGLTYASWTFRKAAKFFDVVTYTGNGANRTIAHNLGSVPGVIIVKRTDTIGDWQVYHRSLANTEYLVLNSTAAKATGTTLWNSTTPTSAEFSLGTDSSVNASGGTYVAYLFAHDAGGFGDSGSESVVKCGSYTGNGSTSGPVIDLGWEPQWLLIKLASGTTAEDWYIYDSMRGIATGGSDPFLRADLTAQEVATSNHIDLLATGFQPTTTATATNQSGTTYIYIAIRRGPMKTPTDATKVFNAVVNSGTGTARTVQCGFTPDSFWPSARNTINPIYFGTRVTGAAAVTPTSNVAEYATALSSNAWQQMDGVYLSGGNEGNYSGRNYISYFFRRSPGFFDVVTYTGTGVAATVPHNLRVVPELIFVKRRNTTGDFAVFAGVASEYLVLNSTAAKVTSNTDRWNNTAPTASAFSIGTDANVNASGGTYTAYMFASLPGVAKVGTYTGTAATLDVNCGFTNGARFVLIKRTDATGDWYHWDTARGIVAANDPYLLLNTALSAEVANTDYIDPLSSGFQISSTAPAAINASGGTFIYLAIA